jgi:DNA-binding transcriptional ArsR family regulator
MTDVQLTQELQVDTIQMKKAALIFRAINHPLRQQMLRLLHLKSRLTVTEIYVALRLEQSVASQHLAILRRAHLVGTERAAKNIFYSVNYRELERLHGIAAQLVNG